MMSWKDPWKRWIGVKRWRGSPFSGDSSRITTDHWMMGGARHSFERQDALDCVSVRRPFSAVGRTATK